MLVRVQPAPAYVLPSPRHKHTRRHQRPQQPQLTTGVGTYVLRRYVRPLVGTNELTLLVTAQDHCDAYAASLPVK